jgi:membrane-bound lytic murein transglycosylase A
VKAVSFIELAGWETDNHAEALATFRKSCSKRRPNDVTKAEDWKDLYAITKYVSNPKAFFEIFFQPVLIEDGKSTLFTGYYEPEIIASRTRVGKFKYPLYKRPEALKEGVPWKTRAEIENGALEGQGLELAWLADPVENFFLHVQGSGRLKLNEGGSMRVGFAGKNHQTYRSVGKELIRRGVLKSSNASAGSIKTWVRNNPVEGRKLLQHNSSFVFFRELINLSESDGPIGAMGISVTDDRTLAMDPKFQPLGTPIWINKLGAKPLHRLMIAQDVGSAIKGAQRADIFYGTGAEAGRVAGTTKDTGRMITLLPHASARRLLPEG